MRASILDIQAPIHLPDVVAVAEAVGYHRYWVTEHHGPRQSASPTLATALAAGVSERLRVGMGGVLLRIQAPLRVAADLALLQTFFPGRIDLGIAGAAASAGVAEAITGQPPADDATYRRRIEELIRLVTAEPSVPCSAHVEGPEPELWLCGTSPASARLAGELGMRYAFHAYLARGFDGAEVGRIYRDAFRSRAAAAGDRPYFAVAAYGWIDDGSGAFDPAHPPLVASTGTFSGTVADCTAQIASLVDRLAADEIFVDCFQPGVESRVAALAALAESLGLSTRS